uniref:Uncharacterized protein n=1 Tax=Rhodogorgon sp. TaxID=2485824 RepID=A0A3G3MI36_9FLOR|nr:hypothetical protein [Rhodogorgon sp.]
MGELNMQFLNNEYQLDNINELLVEKPIGWSSACLDSTIDYYLEYYSANLEKDEQLKNDSDKT